MALPFAFDKPNLSIKLHFCLIKILNDALHKRIT